MLTRFFDFNDTFSMMDAFERQLQSSYFDGPRASQRTTVGSDISFKDEGDKLVLTAVVPGFTKNDVELTIEGETLTLKAERKLEVPKEYKLVRRERAALQLKRQIDLGVPVHADGVEASLEDGILTVTVPKAPEAKPRKIMIGSRPEKVIGNA
jgi:HSP20 family protein